MSFPMLPLLCVLYTVTATGHALSCKVCVASYSRHCDGSSMICPAGHVCASSYTKTTKDDITLDANFVMACSPREQCDTQGSVSIPHGKIKRSTTCCYSDNCTPETPQLSEDDPNDNGLICATCVSANSDSCYPENTMRCTGKENMCLLQTTYTYAPVQSTIALRGCATKSLCDLGTQKVSFGQVNMTMKFKCSSSGSILHCPLFLVFIITLTVIKMFYV